MPNKSSHSPELPNNEIPWWQDGKTTSEELIEPHFLSKGVYGFWLKVRSWLMLPLAQADALTCSESLLTLQAWDKDIERFNNEPLSLFRKRVKFAAINAKDSGSVAGFKAIFKRLDIGIIAFKERESASEWDVCTIELTDNDISQNSKLLQTLIEQYGRTCRRYRFQVLYPSTLYIACGEFSHNFAMFNAQNKETVALLTKPLPIDYQQQVFVASVSPAK